MVHHRWTDHTGRVSQIEIDSTQTQFISASWDKTENIKLFDLNTGKCTRAFPNTSSPITGLKFYEKDLFCSSSLTGELSFWDKRSPDRIFTVNDTQNSWILGVNYAN